MDIEKLEKEKREEFEILATKLDELQRVKNNGRGVDCVRTITSYLRYGDIESAKATCFNESDKIRSYPDIKELLETDLIKEKF